MPSTTLSDADCDHAIASVLYRSTPSVPHDTSPEDGPLPQHAELTVPVAPTRDELVRLSFERLQRLLAMRGNAPPTLDEDTTLIGAPSAVLDSLGWVLFVVDLEQELEDRFGPATAFAHALDSKGVLEAVTVGSLAALIEGVLRRGLE